MIRISGDRKTMRRPRRKSKRTGGATTELAVCLPVVALLVFASLESCSMIFLRQALCATTYEGVRVAIHQEATNGQVIERCREILKARNVKGSAITIDVTNVAAVELGKPITVTVRASCDANSIMPPWFFGGRSLAASASMVKE